MTVLASTAFSGPFTPDGIVKDFPFTFAAASPSEVQAVRRPATGADVPLTGYTVAVNSDHTGTVTFAIAPAAGDPLYLLSNPNFLQQVNFPTQGKWSPSAMNAALDREAIRDIDLRARSDASVRAPLGEVLADLPPLAGRTGKFLSFDGAGNPIMLAGTAVPGPAGPAGDAAMAATRVVLAAIAGAVSGAARFLAEAGREGLFVFSTVAGDATLAAADTYQGIYLAGSGGTWVRRYGGAVQASWFGVSAGGATNAAALESIVTLLGATAPPVIRLAQGTIPFERDVYFRYSVIIHGGGGQDLTAPGTLCTFPAGYSGFRFGTDNSAFPRQSVLSDVRVYQPTRNTTTATGNYNPATRTFTITGGTNDYQNKQIVRVEGAGVVYTVPGKLATTTNGSNVATIATNGLGNPGVYIGQYIDIAGAGLPAGTKVTAWTSSTITLSNNATISVTGAAYTVKWPVLAKILSGGGTASLVLDSYDSTDQSATGVTLSHADAGLVVEAPIRVERSEFVGFPTGRYYRGYAGGAQGAACNFSRSYSNMSGTVKIGLFISGDDANGCSFIADDFENSSEIGTLDTALIANYYSHCNWAFNIGIAAPRPSSSTSLSQCYIESGTSYPGSGNGCSIISTTSAAHGSGWATLVPGGTGFTTGPITIVGTRASVTAPEAYFGGRSIIGLGSVGGGRLRIEGDMSGIIGDGASGIGLEPNRDASRFNLVAYNRTTSAFAPLRLDGSQIEIAPSDTVVATVDSTGLLLAAGAVVKNNSLQVLGARGAALPADATDLATALTLVNAIKARLKATGGHGLVAD